MGWLSLLSSGKGLLKSKWFWAAIIVVVIAFYVSKYTSMIEDLSSAYAEIQGLSKSLETTNQSIDVLRSEMERIDTYTSEREESRKEIREELQSTRKELAEAREKNERLKECWSVDHGDAFSGMRSVPDED